MFTEIVLAAVGERRGAAAETFTTAVGCVRTVFFSWSIFPFVSNLINFDAKFTSGAAVEAMFFRPKALKSSYTLL